MMNEMHHTMTMYENACTLLDEVSSSLSNKNKCGFCNEQCDLKQVSMLMSVMESKSQAAINVLSSDASQTAYKRLQRMDAEEIDDLDCDDGISLAHKKCNTSLSENCSLVLKKSKPCHTKIKIGGIHSSYVSVEGNNFHIKLWNGSKISISKPSKGKYYKPLEIWTIIADNVKKEDLRSCLLALIDNQLIPCKLRNAYSWFIDYMNGKEVK